MIGMLRPFLLLLLSPASAPDTATTQPAQDPAPAPADSLDMVMLQLGQVDARLTVPVDLGARRPYPFIIDTGAERTVVSRELAGTLGLVADRPVMLTSMTGTRQVETVLVPRLTIPTVGVQHRVVAPALEARNLGALGLLGIDTLQAHQVTIDFDAGTMAVRPSTRRPKRSRPAEGEIVVTARSLFGQLIVTDAYVGDARVQVVLDTGAQVTMGNSALRRKIGRGKKTEPIEFVSVTGERGTADYTTVPDIKIGNISFSAMPVAFADVVPFERFGLTRRPALLLGMDALRAFRRVEIDFPNRQVRFLMPRPGRGRMAAP